MKHRLVDEKPRTFVLVFETGDELSDGLKRFAKEQNLSAASFKAIGALSSVELGWFNWDTKKYETSVTLDEQMELLSLIGDVALQEHETVVHAHAVIGKRRDRAWRSSAVRSDQADLRSRIGGKPCAPAEKDRSGIRLGPD